MIDDFLNVNDSLFKLLTRNSLTILDFANGFHDVLRVVLQVLDALVKLFLILPKLTELPAADAHQSAIEKYHLAEPFDSDAERLLV